MGRSLGESVRQCSRGGSIRDDSSVFDPSIGQNMTRYLRIGLLLSVVLFVICGCVYVPPLMGNRAEANRRHLNEVQVGQTIADVRAIMRKDPEKREVRARFDGKTVEFWSYVTDYGRRLDSTITFLDGRVQEIRTTPWLEKD